MSDGQDDVPETLKSNLVQTVFSQVQKEFVDWNVVYCRQVLTSLTPPSTWRSCLHPDFRFPCVSSMQVTTDAHSTLLSSESQTFSQQVYSPDGVVIESFSAALEVIRVTSSLEPHPLYESCSPQSRSVFKGDDSDAMGFIPYADDHTFDQLDHLRHYGLFSWQEIFDPDLEVISLEAVYRLKTHHALTYNEIESSNVLPLKLRPESGKSGLLAAFRRRDRLHWTGNTIPTHFMFLPQSPERSDFRSRLKAFNALLCPNLSCVESLCSVHEPNPWPLKLPSPVPRTLRDVTIACQNQCFIDNKIEETIPTWDEADLEEFKAISEISLDVTPCDLATLCIKPCCEVYHHWKLLYSSNPGEARPAETKTQRRIPRFNDNDPTKFTPNDPCDHAGPCSVSSDCPCFKNRSHCRRNCHCPLECYRRWKGCRCLKTKPKDTCMTERCPCVEAFRECDPELCTNCRSHDTSCRNSQIQRGAHKALEIKRSSWGLGTFLAESARADDLIAEYVGEMIYEPTVESRADLAAHRNRCYVFGLNDTISMDSTYLGNISRFIDHAEESRRVNSRAQVRLVNGDHRIGIYAIRDMEAGSQVLMNYGSMFFVE